MQKLKDGAATASILKLKPNQTNVTVGILSEQSKERKREGLKSQHDKWGAVMNVKEGFAALSLSSALL